jgi:hypothetical protein
MDISLIMPKETSPNLSLALRAFLFILYLALIVLGIVITKTAAPLLALVLIYWVVENITALIPVASPCIPKSPDGNA